MKRWQIDAKLGTGSTAVVYSATNVDDGRRAALKILRCELDDTIRRRFSREGFVANAVGHPGVVQIFDQGVTDDGAPFIVMEYLDGESLEARRTERGGTLSVDEVIDIGCELLDVLSAAHARGIIHRDLKPANVFITAQRTVKVLDFGTAHLTEPGPTPSGNSEITRTGMVIGTPAFMPPEQASGRRSEVDERSDVWALGAMLFTLLAGRPVHVAASPAAQVFAAMTKPAPLLSTVAPDVPRAVAAVIDRALAFERAERWADAESMRRALRWARQPDARPAALENVTPVKTVDAAGIDRASAEGSTPRAEVVPFVGSEDTPSVYDADTRIGPGAAVALAAQMRSETTQPISLRDLGPPAAAPMRPVAATPVHAASWWSTLAPGAIACVIAGAVALVVLLSVDRVRHRRVAHVSAVSSAVAIPLEANVPIALPIDVVSVEPSVVPAEAPAAAAEAEPPAEPAPPRRIVPRPKRVAPAVATPEIVTPEPTAAPATSDEPASD